MTDFGEIADAAKTFACTLHKNQPGALIPNPISDALLLVWDEFCGNPPGFPPGLPPPPAPPFTGGQCCDLLYKVNIRSVNSIGTVADFSLRFKAGQILGVFNTPTSTNDSWQLRRKRCSGAIELDSVVGGAKPVSCAITSVVLENGQPDTCGDPPKEYPPAPPPPPGGYNSPPVPITINNGDTINYTFNFTPPSPPISPVVNLPPVIINLVRPTLDFKIPIQFDFNGDVSFGGGDGGFGQPDRDDLDNINIVTNNTQNDVLNLTNTVNNIVNNTNNKPPDPADYLPPVTNQPPGEHEKSYLAAVKITLTTIPKNARIQSGVNAPDVIYAGWFEWKQAGFKLPREPIHFKDAIFLAPKGVDGYAFTLYTGFIGTATEIINKEKI